MKKLLLIALAAFGLAGASQASLATMYNYDTRNFASSYNGRDTVFVAGRDGRVNEFYYIRGNRVEALYSGVPGIIWSPAGMAQVMTYALDYAGQKWLYDGRSDFHTNDGRLWAKLFWYNGIEVLRIARKNHIDRFGLWAPSAPRSHPRTRIARKSKPTPQPENDLPRVDLNV
jgi:hypothetical protein